MDLDFSEFHPTGDHWPGSACCRTFAGGWRRHLHLAWVFHRRDQVLRPFRRMLFCPLGRHRWQVWHSRESLDRPVTIHPMCLDCPTTRLPSEYDADSVPKLPWLEGP
jgi:hypothetical protein